MSFAQLSIEKKVISWMFTLLLLIGGGVSYFDLGQLEDPEFTFKKAMVITMYPGASPQPSRGRSYLSYRKCDSAITLR